MLRWEDVLEAVHQEFEERLSVRCMAIVVLEQPRASGAAHGGMDLGCTHREVDGELRRPPCLAHVARSLAVTLEADPSRGVVDEQQLQRLQFSPSGDSTYELCRSLYLPMIVAVAAARVVQVSGDEVVDVIAVRHRFVAAARTVGVSRVVRATCMGRSTRRRIRRVDVDRALVDVTIVAAVQVAVVEVVLMVAVCDRLVAAAGAVLM